MEGRLWPLLVLPICCTAQVLACNTTRTRPVDVSAADVETSTPTDETRCREYTDGLPPDSLAGDVACAVEGIPGDSAPDTDRVDVVAADSHQEGTAVDINHVDVVVDDQPLEECTGPFVDPADTCIFEVLACFDPMGNCTFYEEVLLKTWMWENGAMIQGWNGKGSYFSSDGTECYRLQVGPMYDLTFVIEDPKSGAYYSFSHPMMPPCVLLKCPDDKSQVIDGGKFHDAQWPPGVTEQFFCAGE